MSREKKRSGSWPVDFITMTNRQKMSLDCSFYDGRVKSGLDYLVTAKGGINPAGEIYYLCWKTWMIEQLSGNGCLDYMLAL